MLLFKYNFLETTSDAPVIRIHAIKEVNNQKDPCGKMIKMLGLEESLLND